MLFNDPFDVTQELRLNFDEATLTAALNERLATLVEEGRTSEVRFPPLAPVHELMRSISPDRRKPLANALRNAQIRPTLGQAAAIADLRTKWRELVPTFRVLCLSELNDVTPMWNHYADQYKGVVLEFSPVFHDSPFLVARPVVYQDEPPLIANPHEWAERLLGQRQYWDLFRELQFMKTLAWAYEKEWRIVSGARPEDAAELFGDYGFHEQDLIGIYLGPKCSDTDRADLVALLKHGLEHVRVYEATPDFLRGQFTFRSIPR